MIIKKVSIKTFGGVSNREIEFQNGLNVILGPNESGKSTIFHAIERTLFTPTRLTPSKFKRQMGRFIPIEGGDTIEVSIHFEDEGGEYVLRRRWGASALSELKLPGGSVVSDDDSIQEIIRGCLEVPEGTCRTVMMTYQSGLSRTIDDLKDDRDTLESFGDLLRKAVMEMDGVSVDAFRNKIEEAYRSYLGRWDLKANYPEKSRGIENPWVKNVGSVVEAFYEKEKVRAALEAALQHEQELDNVNRKISDLAIKIDKAESYLKDNKAIKEDAEKRRQIETELKGINLEYEKLAEINKDWPVVESKISEITQKLPELEKEYEKNKGLLERFKRVEKKKQAVEEAKKDVSGARKITKDDLKALRKALNRVKQLEASLSAGKLFATFTTKTPAELEIQKGVEEKTKEKLSAGESLQIEADGILRMSHPEWDMEVSSGAEYAEVLADYDKAKASADRLLKELGVKDLDEAEDLNSSYEEKIKDLESAEANLKEELEEYTYEDLKKTIQELKPEKPTNELGVILKERAEIHAEIKTLEKDLDGLKKTQQAYVQKYGDHDKLIQKLADVAGKKARKQEELGKLKPLPPDIEDVDQFIQQYEKKEGELTTLKEQHNVLIQERIRLESTAPDRSVEEFQKELAEAEERFNTQLRKGKAIARIKEVMERLLEEMDTETYTGLEQHVAELIEKMTGGRYGDVVMRETIPTGLQRKDGTLIPYNYLSMGTVDTLGLSLRLAITQMFLGDRENLVIMDDPLVDLDPDRQSRAGEAIKEFAKHKQIILLTCHPSHAHILGGHQIHLD
ncbi:MAG: SMC family ATPase [Deltaproteobacteria bacterium]|nr:SMC family ATPase [Deltaproteobacteria bacterium]